MGDQIRFQAETCLFPGALVEDGDESQMTLIKDLYKTFIFIFVYRLCPPQSHCLLPGGGGGGFIIIITFVMSAAFESHCRSLLDFRFVEETSVGMRQKNQSFRIIAKIPLCS